MIGPDTATASSSSAVGVSLESDNPALQHVFDAAITGLRANRQTVMTGEPPVLIEGAEYAGIWLECGPHESLLYGLYANDPETAREGHRMFFRHQHEDGYLPCWLRRDKIGSGQIQTVVPIARTALEVYKLWGDRAFLEEAYNACASYDNWLSRYRDTRGTGLCELFCEWDTGHDNSPRHAGLPHACPDMDARVCPDLPDSLGMPRIAPDLSATKYGGRVALSHMALALDRPNDAHQWRAKASHVQRRISEICFDADTSCFYDLDSNGSFVKTAGDALTRVLQEHVVLPLSGFDAIYDRWIRNPGAFWTPYPLPSIAANDPAFGRDLPRNSWGGASQALTALRAPRWLAYYGKHADLTHLMTQWVNALCRADGFRQQMDPWTGDFTASGSDGYSPAMLCMVDFTARLYGVRPGPEGLEWNCRLPAGTSRLRFALPLPGGNFAEIVHEPEQFRLMLNGSVVATVYGGPCRVVTDTEGMLRDVIGTEGGVHCEVTIETPNANPQTVVITPDCNYFPL